MRYKHYIAGLLSGVLLSAAVVAGALHRGALLTAEMAEEMASVADGGPGGGHRPPHWRGMPFAGDPPPFLPLPPPEDDGPAGMLAGQARPQAGLPPARPSPARPPGDTATGPVPPSATSPVSGQVAGSWREDGWRGRPGGRDGIMHDGHPPPWMGERGEHDMARAAVQAGEIRPLRQVLEAAESQFQGQMLEAELDHRDDRQVYEIKMLSPDGSVFKLYYDGLSGTLLKVRGRDVGRWRRDSSMPLPVYPPPAASPVTAPASSPSGQDTPAAAAPAQVPPAQVPPASGHTQE